VVGKRKKVKITYREIDGVLTAGKECTKCGEWKPLETGFANNKGSVGGKSSQCKSCKKLVIKKWRQDNREYLLEQKRKWRIENREYRIEYNRKWRQENREYCREYRQKYLHENREKEIERRKRYKRENREKIKVYKQKRRARKNLLPATWTEEQRVATWSHFNNACALTGEGGDIHEDHVIPLAVGHGGTTYGNMIPLRADLNDSKCDRNIFEWFSENRERFNLSEERFNRLIEYLATLNGLTVDEYRQFVYWCHENPREPHEIAADPRHSIEIWREATGRHFPLPAYAIENDNMSDNKRSAS
jgi:hypothetical protein